VNNPHKTVTELASKICFSFGEKTEDIIKTVSRTKKPRDYNILNKIDPKIQSQVEHYSNLIENMQH
jgi:argonaute-like protein implicated in RNA metabolism and viral defense